MLSYVYFQKKERDKLCEEMIGTIGDLKVTDFGMMGV